MESGRAKEQRKNQGVFVSGMTGAGKGRMSARLAGVWRRVIYIDPTACFDADVRAGDFKEAADLIQKRWKGRDKFSIACTFTDDAEYRKLFGGLRAVVAGMRGMAGNVLIVFDEIDLWSSPHKIDPNISEILRYGRHWGVSWIAVCRADVETHRDVRQNPTEIIMFLQGMLSPEMEKKLRAVRKIRDTEIPEIHNLKKHEDPTPELATENVHFIAVPDDFETFSSRWKALAETD